MRATRTGAEGGMGRRGGNTTEGVVDGRLILATEAMKNKITMKLTIIIIKITKIIIITIK